MKSIGFLVLTLFSSLTLAEEPTVSLQYKGHNFQCPYNNVTSPSFHIESTSDWIDIKVGIWSKCVEVAPFTPDDVSIIIKTRDGKHWKFTKPIELP